MEKEKEMICKQALSKALDTEFPDEYSLNGYKEDAVCLQQDGNKWKVFVGFRNMHEDEEIFGSLIEACMGMIRMISAGDNEREERLSNIFLDYILVEQIA